ncbi:hypothetical protein BDV28DRAFT_146242 [Aspergillus coremiiformis]|uniref:Uncharacterized protein n=1 Tax=Aspergillus coremiiformis TaxID=138285 RepID=A0A5N6ZCH8_9EURO|nr:hypothetical protein BDV28DRAFT_146242 [Aspergillus coremiiformis]
MYFPLLFALSSALSLASASAVYDCPFAQDRSGLFQKPYCCEGFKDAPHTNLTKVGLNCTEQTDNVVEVCPNGFTPKCCYWGGVGPLCTAEAVVRESE